VVTRAWHSCAELAFFSSSPPETFPPPCVAFRRIRRVRLGQTLPFALASFSPFFPSHPAIRMGFIVKSRTFRSPLFFFPLPPSKFSSVADLPLETGDTLEVAFSPFFPPPPVSFSSSFNCQDLERPNGDQLVEKREHPSPSFLFLLNGSSFPLPFSSLRSECRP